LAHKKHIPLDSVKTIFSFLKHPSPSKGGTRRRRNRRTRRRKRRT
jgi:hypothetical protein